MKTVSISGSPRENVGKKDAKKLRREGKIPCVVYGGQEQVFFYAETLSFRDLVYTPHAYFAELDVNGKKYNTILQDIQFHPVSEQILHIDFLEIFPDKPIIMEIPVKITGSSKGVMKGGKLVLLKRKLKVKGLPDNLPDFIEVDITKLEIGEGIKVGELELDNVELIDPHSSMIVSVRTSRAAALAEEEGEEGAEGTEGEGASEEAKAE